MEKHNSNPEEYNREWRKFYVQLGSRALELCQSETMLFSHSEPYKHYDLVQHKTGLYLRIENQELFNALAEEEFTEVYQEQPDPIHYEAINEKWQKSVTAGAEMILELEDEK